MRALGEEQVEDAEIGLEADTVGEELVVLREVGSWFSFHIPAQVDVNTGMLRHVFRSESDVKVEAELFPKPKYRGDICVNEVFIGLGEKLFK